MEFKTKNSIENVRISFELQSVEAVIIMSCKSFVCTFICNCILKVAIGWIFNHNLHMQISFMYIFYCEVPFHQRHHSCWILCQFIGQSLPLFVHTSILAKDLVCLGHSFHGWVLAFHSLNNKDLPSLRRVTRRPLSFLALQWRIFIWEEHEQRVRLIMKWNHLNLVRPEFACLMWV